MADSSSRLNFDTHLILDQPLLRLPFELLRKNLLQARGSVEKGSTAVRNSLKETANASLSNSSSPDDVLKNIDTMISRMRGLKRKLTTCVEEENRLHQHSLSRIKHLGELAAMHSLEDVKYEAWSRTRLDRLLVDYLLRNGYKQSAVALAKEKGIEDLVDVDIFVQMSRIRDSLRNGKVAEALAWCNENKKELRKMDNNLEFMLRFQQYIELVRTQDQAKLLEAIQHAKKFINPYEDTYRDEVQKAAGLLAFTPGDEPSSYNELFSQTRWNDLANVFTQTHNALLALPSVPLLHIALSAGLSALKTPSCHSTHLSPSAGVSASASITTSVCPICSTELNELARKVPYAQHTTSHVEPDAVVLPNGRVYGLHSLEEYSRKSGLDDERKVKDLTTGEVFYMEQIKKVFIS